MALKPYTLCLIVTAPIPQNFVREEVENYGNGDQFARGEGVKVRKADVESGDQGFAIEEIDGGVGCRKGWWCGVKRRVVVWRGRKIALAMGLETSFRKLRDILRNMPRIGPKHVRRYLGTSPIFPRITAKYTHAGVAAANTSPTIPN